MTPQQEISLIDKKIDAVVAAAQTAFGKKPRTAAGCQRMWDAHPDLYAKSQGLYRERGEAQLRRDNADYREAMRVKRSLRVKTKLTKCNSCGSFYSAAA